MKVPAIKKVNTGNETFSFISLKIRNSLTNDLNSAKTLSSFKSQIKDFEIRNCLCSVCETYVPGADYFD